MYCSRASENPWLPRPQINHGLPVDIRRLGGLHVFHAFEIKTIGPYTLDQLFKKITCPLSTQRMDMLFRYNLLET